VAGKEVTYTATTRNDGPSDAVKVTVSDTVPDIYYKVSWTWEAAGKSCGSGTGNSISTVVDRIPAPAARRC
jgi:uncharacterized repeat protein (TIGR01451 family)